MLTAPKVNEAFCWNAAAELGLNKPTIYIAISEEHPLVKNLFKEYTDVLPSEDASFIASEVTLTGYIISQISVRYYYLGWLQNILRMRL